MKNLNFFQALINHGEFEKNPEAQAEIENYFIGILSNNVPPGVWAYAIAEALRTYKNIHRPPDTGNAT